LEDSGGRATNEPRSVHFTIAGRERQLVDLYVPCCSCSKIDWRWKPPRRRRCEGGGEAGCVHWNSEEWSERGWNRPPMNYCSPYNSNFTIVQDGVFPALVHTLPRGKIVLCVCAWSMISLFQRLGRLCRSPQWMDPSPSMNLVKILDRPAGSFLTLTQTYLYTYTIRMLRLISSTQKWQKLILKQANSSVRLCTEFW
jgi:hypothetical protein